MKKYNIIITWGFIGATSENFTTTLVEGSDYSAAIFSFCLDAQEMTVWKDDAQRPQSRPKFYDDAVKLEQISYHDAIELDLRRNGHPSQNDQTARQRRPDAGTSFKAPEKGTRHRQLPTKPLRVYLQNRSDPASFQRRLLLHCEDNSRIFHSSAEHRAKVNLMQNSAISFSHLSRQRSHATQATPP